MIAMKFVYFIQNSVDNVGVSISYQAKEFFTWFLQNCKSDVFIEV